MKTIIQFNILLLCCTGIGFCLGIWFETNRARPSGPEFIGSGKIASPAFSGTNIVTDFKPTHTNVFTITPN
jgi:hypothetical protein